MKKVFVDFNERTADDLTLIRVPLGEMPDVLVGWQYPASDYEEFDGEIVVESIDRDAGTVFVRAVMETA